jgi:membrane-bound lytic murein transglycosylase B
MVTTPQPPRRRARTVRTATALAAAVTGGVVGSALLTGASADVLAEPAAGTPVSEPQVVLVQRVERPVVIRAEKGTRLSAKGNDLFEISALGSFDVPEAALRAYKAAVAATNGSHPSCDLPWTLLAAIGRVESDHGRYGGSVLGSDGLPRPAIRGVALNGVGPVAAIADSDNGRFDGDKVWDRAVGPMQFIPTTWAGSGRDGDGDGVANPNDIDDAALAAAGYLCAEDRDTATGEGWWDGVLTYNASGDYARLVWAAAERYGTPPAS